MHEQLLDFTIIIKCKHIIVQLKFAFVVIHMFSFIKEEHAVSYCCWLVTENAHQFSGSPNASQHRTKWRTRRSANNPYYNNNKATLFPNSAVMESLCAITVYKNVHMVNKGTVTVFSTHLCPPASMAKVKRSSSSLASSLLLLALWGSLQQSARNIILLMFNNWSMPMFARATRVKGITCCHLLYSSIKHAIATRQRPV